MIRYRHNTKQVRHFDKYSRMGGSWSWNAPSYQRDVVNLVKAERRMEEDIASALTEVDAIEAGLRCLCHAALSSRNTT